jgi:hypothetical protein
MRTRPEILLAQAKLKLAYLQRKLTRWTALARTNAVSTDDYEDLQFQVEHQLLEIELAQLDCQKASGGR